MSSVIELKKSTEVGNDPATRVTEESGVATESLIVVETMASVIKLNESTKLLNESIGKVEKESTVSVKFSDNGGLSVVLIIEAIELNGASENVNVD